MKNSHILLAAAAILLVGTIGFKLYAQSSDKSATKAISDAVTRQGSQSSAPSLNTSRALKLPASATTQAALSSKGYSSTDVSRFDSISFDVSSLMTIWREGASNPSALDFLGTRTELTKFSQSANGRLKNMLFKAVDYDGWVALVIDPESKAVNGYALLDGNNYDIVSRPDPNRGQQYVLVQVKPPVADTKGDTLPRAARAPSTYKTCETAERTSLGAPLTILFGFTAAAERNVTNRYDGGTGLQPLIGNVGNHLDDLFTRAGLDATVVLFDSFKVAYSEPTADGKRILDHTLDALLNNEDPSLADFRNARRELEADIAVLIVDTKESSACGKANLGATADDAFAVVNWRCMASNYTAEHEIGHVLGLHHDHDPSADPKFATAFVHASPTDEHAFTTLMGTRDNCRAKVDCYRAPLLSNPFDNHKPAGGGQVVIGVQGRIDNACLLKQTLPKAIAFGEQL